MNSSCSLNQIKQQIAWIVCAFWFCVRFCVPEYACMYTCTICVCVCVSAAVCKYGQASTLIASVGVCESIVTYIQPFDRSDKGGKKVYPSRSNDHSRALNPSITASVTAHIRWLHCKITLTHTHSHCHTSLTACSKADKCSQGAADWISA